VIEPVAGTPEPKIGPDERDVRTVICGSDPVDRVRLLVKSVDLDTVERIRHPRSS
jgi:hypothetical protein